MNLTEKSPATVNPRPTDSLKNRCDTVGRVLPHTSIRIVDTNDELYPSEFTPTVPIGESGDLWSAGYALQRGYLNNEKETVKTQFTDTDGARWIKTGDRASMDSNRTESPVQEFYFQCKQFLNSSMQWPVFNVMAQSLIPLSFHRFCGIISMTFFLVALAMIYYLKLFFASESFRVFGIINGIAVFHQLGCFVFSGLFLCFSEISIRPELFLIGDGRLSVTAAVFVTFLVTVSQIVIFSIILVYSILMESAKSKYCKEILSLDTKDGYDLEFLKKPAESRIFLNLG